MCMKSEKGIAGIVLVIIAAVVLGGVFLYIRTDPQIQGYESAVKNFFFPKDEGLVIDFSEPTAYPLTVAAGDDISILSPESTIVLSGSVVATTPGAIGYDWVKISGGSATIVSPRSKQTRVIGLSRGVYIFRLVAADSVGNKAADDVAVAVFPLPNGTPGASTYKIPVGVSQQSVSNDSAPASSSETPRPNIPPFVTSGGDQVLAPLARSTTLLGSGSDSDGSVVLYVWSKVSGGNSVIVSPNVATSGVTGLTQGVYVFRLTAKDNQGAISSDTVSVTIPASINTKENIPPIADAGEDQLIESSSLTLFGVGSDEDGTIVSYQWNIEGDDPGVSITSPSSSTTVITGLSQGDHTFNFIVTDNQGATDTATVVITVQ